VWVLFGVLFILLLVFVLLCILVTLSVVCLVQFTVSEGCFLLIWFGCLAVCVGCFVLCRLVCFVFGFVYDSWFCCCGLDVWYLLHCFL